MPSRTTHVDRLFVPQGTPQGDIGIFRKEYLHNVSNWEYYPGTKKPNLTRQNAHAFLHNFCHEGWVTPGMFLGSETAFHPTYAPEENVGIITPSQMNEALARFNGRIRKGSASLGVTLASWKQSREMIVKRCQDTGKVLDGAYRSLKGSPSRRRKVSRKRDPLANEVLEGEFGWKPLAQDLTAALTTVCQDGIPPQWCKGRAKRSIHKVVLKNETLFETLMGESLVTVSGCVSISNPNLWLLNRLGLINPATVIWDLIPWSFVVNMFVNVNQMISSITDRVGLDITEQSTTRSSNLILESLRFGPAGFTDLHERDLKGLLVGKAKSTCKFRDRAVGDFPNPQWEVKVPELNWELAVIASSLLLQKAQRLNSLIRGI